MTDTAPVQPIEGQGQPAPPAPDSTQVAPPVAPPAAPVAPPPGNGPWASDLAQLFPDESVRGTVDQFLREKVQPYTTQLEQRVSGTKDAARLWTDLSENPIDTYVALTHEMFGEEAAQRLLTDLQAQQAQNPQQVQAPAQTSDPRLESVVSWVEQEQAARQYGAEMQRVKGAHPDVDPELFHPFVAAAEGNFDVAYDLYSSWVQQWQASHGGQAPQSEQQVAPPVLGDGGDAPTTPPVAPRRETLDEAISGFMADQRVNADAPPVT